MSELYLATTKYPFHTESTVSIMVEPSQIVYETLISRLMSMPVETNSLQQLSTTGIIVCYGINICIIIEPMSSKYMHTA